MILPQSAAEEPLLRSFGSFRNASNLLSRSYERTSFRPRTALMAAFFHRLPTLNKTPWNQAPSLDGAITDLVTKTRTKAGSTTVLMSLLPAHHRRPYLFRRQIG